MKKAIIFFLVTIALLFYAIVVSSCNPSKKAHKFANSNPKEFADFCATVYPCAIDSSHIPKRSIDSSKYIEAIRELQRYIQGQSDYYDSILSTDNSRSSEEKILFLQTLLDQKQTLINSLKEKIKNIPPVHDSIPVPYPVDDPAKLQAKQNQINDLIVNNKDLVGQKDSAKHSRNIWMIIALIFIAKDLIKIAWKIWGPKFNLTALFKS